ncbi:hydrophobe/amphiphile efflux-1 (HAE1) family protein [Thiothrix eikelboomii]|uniref:Hydrophobe/amphiphile efflux-1 (HAE1) family protein n=1 Tax=Thiothrix eikelboomii TaxID=92487 RepID=A0A1T4X1I7_9GAMM|nr:efflux RND transporter permease subunit [Thiothrix eikelboomii]SKA83444.1 hydrophobe/amphiphile efflux-1 (HAE1) family protein [Thiothrix eikelboomii]
MNISAWSIRNPVPSILLFVVLSFLGIHGFKSLLIQQFPDIELPVITVSAGLEGASPSQLETEVTRKVEDAVASLGGIKHIQSTLTDGSSVTAIEFTIDKDTEIALSEVRNAVDGIRAELPGSMSDPVVSKVTTTGNPIITFTVSSERMDEETLSWFVDNEVSKAMMAVPGVGRSSRIGGVNREVQVNLNPALMAGLGVTADAISQALGQVQKDASGGRGDIGGGVQSVRTLGAVETAEDLASLPIPLAGGRYVRLDQIAKVEDTYSERAMYALWNGKQVVGFQITRTKGAGEVDTAQRVREAVQKLAAEHPQVTISEAYDTVTSVQENYEGSMLLMIEGAFLAILVVWIFLRDFRSTIVSAVALPLAILPTFALIYYLGYSLNLLTLLALALVVGVLVDDAIVEVENIVRHLHMGKTPYQAAMEAADEIGLAVIATTSTLIAVFLPTAFMGGVPGKFFEPFGITAAIAVFFSLVVARLLTPMMAAYMLKAPKVHQQKDGWIMRNYLRVMKGCLRHRFITLFLAIAFFIGSIMLIPLLPTGFIPPGDEGLTAVNVELQPGSTLEETRVVAEQARELISSIPEIKNVFSIVGYESSQQGPFGGGGGTDARKATLTVILSHRTERAMTQQEVENQIRKQIASLPGARIKVGLGGNGEQLQVALASDDASALRTSVLIVEKDLRTLPGVGNITSNASLQRPEIHIVPNFARAAELGISTVSLANVVQIATSGDFESRLPKLNLPQRQIPVRVRLDKQIRTDLQAIQQLRVPGRNGEVPLSAVADVNISSGPTQIQRLERKRNVTIDVELNGRSLGDVAAEVEKLPSLQTLPPSVTRPPSGDVESMQELFGSFGAAMGVGVLVIYVVLVLLFHDFMQPITILMALPLSLGGAFVALMLTHSSFSMPSMIGLVMLMGIVTKNSILLVEYAIVDIHERGMNRFDALVDACHKRARPIVMTTIAMGAGMLPTALGLGVDPSFRSPMAIVVIGGLLASTVLSLLVIPVVFTFIDDLRRGLRWIFMRGKPEVHGAHAPEPAAPTPLAAATQATQ